MSLKQMTFYDSTRVEKRREFVAKNVLSDKILEVNYALYCKAQWPKDAGELCAVQFTFSACQAVLLLVPCNLTLPHATVMCQTTVHKHHSLQPGINWFSIPTWPQWKPGLIRPVKTFCPNSQYFQCWDQTCIHNHHTCDGKDNCPGGHDERNCSRVCTFHSKKSADIMSCYTSCHISNCVCMPGYFQCEHSGGCVPVNRTLYSPMSCLI